jgi:hypothetical protein
LVATPYASPRVASITEMFLLQQHEHRREKILRCSGWPLVLVNAVAGACAPMPVGASFPEDVLTRLNATIAASARRP